MMNLTRKSPLLIYEAERLRRIETYDALLGKPATLYYLPTRLSRKWRKSFFTQRFSATAFHAAITLARNENWHAIQFLED